MQWTCKIAACIVGHPNIVLSIQNIIACKWVRIVMHGTGASYKYMHVLVAMYMHACIFSDFFCRFNVINAKGGVT